MKDTSHNAFPAVEAGNRVLHCGGMTLRDYFAGQALIGILSNSSFEEWSQEYEYTHKMIGEKEWAELSYDVANAMLKERLK